MTDFLLVAGGGLGSWSWGRTWGFLKAPVDHPPRLYDRPPIGKVLSINTSGNTGNFVDSKITPEKAVEKIKTLIGDQDLNSPILVGHDIAAPLVFMTAAALDPPPQRIIMVGGWIPDDRKSPLSVLPLALRAAFTMMTPLHAIQGRAFRIQKHVVRNYFCGGMSEEDVIKSVGYFQPIPVRLLRRGISIREMIAPCPITYIVLNKDKITPPEIQIRMAERLGPLELIEMDACHAVMLHKPEELANMLHRYAK